MLGIKKKVEKTARKAGLMTVGAILCMVGTAFLTVAAWFALVPEFGGTIAALIIAVAYFGVGLILLGVASGRQSETHEPRPAARPVAEKPVTPSGLPPLVQAFLYGLQAGTDADRKKR